MIKRARRDVSEWEKDTCREEVEEKGSGGRGGGGGAGVGNTFERVREKWSEKEKDCEEIREGKGGRDGMTEKGRGGEGIKLDTKKPTKIE